VLASLPIVRATPELVVVDKPAGLLSVPGRGPDKQDCVASRVAAMFPEATGPLTVHRLDMETSGLMVLGLTPEAHRALSMQFEARTVDKHYIALLDGRLTTPRGSISLPLRLDVDNRPRQVVDHAQGKHALTSFRTLGYERSVNGIWCTRVEFMPQTGRSHQLRVHAAHHEGLHHPILGDSLYGDASSAPRLMLHASALALTEPATGSRLTLNSPPPF
jgi:tRNA pseudouridine32 synthase/23S rRNA pseudouridine746 synthase